jgi:hypothetical protein
MTVSFGKLRPELQILGCVVALALVAFAAIRLAGNARDGRLHAMPGATVGSAASAAPAQGAKKPVRYQATQENWRRYRAAAGGAN